MIAARVLNIAILILIRCMTWIERRIQNQINLVNRCNYSSLAGFIIVMILGRRDQLSCWYEIEFEQ
jgi:hypothetical protein